MATSDSLGTLANGGRDLRASAGNSSLGGQRNYVGGLDEEVRSKPRVRRQRAESVTATCGEDGVKSITDILNCADVQLQTSRDFAEKLAQRR